MCSLLLIWGFKYKVMSGITSYGSSEVQIFSDFISITHSMEGLILTFPDSVTLGRHLCPLPLLAEVQNGDNKVCFTGLLGR